MKLNLGCGKYPMEGYVNVDLYADAADVKGDFTEMVFADVEEIVMLHVLEHLPFDRTDEILSMLYDWLQPGGSLLVEVPDMEVLLALGTGYPEWVLWIYGAKEPGERHQGGYTMAMLVQALARAGFEVDSLSIKRFVSDHPERRGYPCCQALARKPGHGRPACPRCGQGGKRGIVNGNSWECPHCGFEWATPQAVMERFEFERGDSTTSAG